MKKLIAGALIALFSLPLYAQQKPTLESLSWLAGCWNRTKGGDGGEYWLKPEGGAMFGISRTLRNGKNISYEFMRIDYSRLGDIYYSVTLPRQIETRFKLIRSENQEAIFENPEHDFPQRIIYKLEKDALKARIEGEVRGKMQAVDFIMVKAACNQ